MLTQITDKITTSENKPLITYFLQDYPYANDVDDFDIYDEELMMNINADGIPFLMAPRASKPPTTCTTPGHSIKGGYTPSGKYKPATYAPSKVDKRAGK